MKTYLDTDLKTDYMGFCRNRVGVLNMASVRETRRRSYRAKAKSMSAQDMLAWVIVTFCSIFFLALTGGLLFAMAYHDMHCSHGVCY